MAFSPPPPLSSPASAKEAWAQEWIVARNLASAGGSQKTGLMAAQTELCLSRKRAPLRRALPSETRFGPSPPCGIRNSITPPTACGSWKKLAIRWGPRSLRPVGRLPACSPSVASRARPRAPAPTSSPRIASRSSSSRLGSRTRAAQSPWPGGTWRGAASPRPARCLTWRAAKAGPSCRRARTRAGGNPCSTGRHPPRPGDSPRRSPGCTSPPRTCASAGLPTATRPRRRTRRPSAPRGRAWAGAGWPGLTLCPQKRRARPIPARSRRAAPGRPRRRSSTWTSCAASCGPRARASCAWGPAAGSCGSPPNIRPGPGGCGCA
ncbi:C2 calcium-dependent domain-containing protein 4D isoform X3 [Symphalangus syndactylus]|uniref:C2 calcium-dependent domain-containing protein 4D isoform X3 n=1 Tax=Symphalangus syndactylus TaxID=9590 RepID=UPI003006DF28